MACSVPWPLKLIFDSANLQTIDHKHESALEKRRGTTLRK
jgi:hypothetical protein